MDIEKLKEFVAESYTYADVCRKLGLKPHGYNYKTIQRYIKDKNIDTSHFTGKRTNICNRLMNNEKDVNEYLKKDSYIKANVLKWKLMTSRLKKYECECCGNSKWNGKQIVLQLHHINGDNTDNRLENLQLLCPNCHSQTENYCGANIKNKNNNKNYYCRACGKEIDKTPMLMCDECYEKLIHGEIEFGTVKQNGKYTTKKYSSLIVKTKVKGICKICGGETSEKKIDVCDKCSHMLSRKVTWPDKETLGNLIKTTSFSRIGEMYGVTDNAVRKWCKSYGLPHRKRDIEK